MLRGVGRPTRKLRGDIVNPSLGRLGFNVHGGAKTLIEALVEISCSDFEGLGDRIEITRRD
jgi:hypothetical protein